MASPSRDHDPKRPSSLIARVPSSKRICTSPGTALLSTMEPPISIPSILNLSEDVVWSLRKGDLRKYFLVLQIHARNPYLIADSTTLPTTPPSSTSESLPPILNLPPEIREIIYSHLLCPPTGAPIRGPHPRQLQTHIGLSQAFAPSILRANRQILNEAIPIFYGSATQCIHITIDYNVWQHKMKRSDLIVSSSITSAMRHLHICVHLGNEKKNNRPGEVESDARLVEVIKGVKKLRKWLAGADIQSLRISWQEPPQTYTWEQKIEVLDGFRPMRPKKFEAGEINWGLNWNKGKKYRFPVEYLKELERSQNGDSGLESSCFDRMNCTCQLV